MTELSTFKDQLPDGVSCLVVVIMCHGKLGHISLSDGKEIQLEEIYQMFNNSQCKVLRKKPKLFIVQACGGVELKTIKIDEAGGSTQPSKTELLPTESDAMVVNAVCPDKLVIRHKDLGCCPMFTGISKVFENCETPPLHMYELFTQMNRSLDENIPDLAENKTDESEQLEQGKIGNSLYIVSSLTKKWYLK
ncbi:caspase-14-like [Salvelinus sp. IW2-2015]|uniref:caspase-14-like n=1 Tax=Salvelinus sp. IW2-2015 TaxID=2691554 RepID=UPI000CEAC154|nr:caspase-14-like [Salvelinus alpinus]